MQWDAQILGLSAFFAWYKRTTPVLFRPRQDYEVLIPLEVGNPHQTALPVLSQHAVSYAGRVKRNTEPTPIWLSTQMWPPCPSTIFRAIARPSPVLRSVAMLPTLVRPKG